MLARRLGSANWATTQPRKSTWRQAFLGTYLTFAGIGSPGKVKTIQFTSDRRIVFGTPNPTATIYGTPAAQLDGYIDLHGYGGPPNLKGSSSGGLAAIGRYLTSAGAVAADAASTWPTSLPQDALSAVGGRIHLRNTTNAAGTQIMRQTNLLTGAVIDWNGTFPFGSNSANFSVLSTGDAVFVVRANQLSAGATSGGPPMTTMPDDGKRPARSRWTKILYDDNPVPFVFKAVDGAQPKTPFPFTFSRPLTTGTIGRGVVIYGTGSTLQRRLALRAHVLWIPSFLDVYEWEFGAAVATGTNERGATYTQTTYTYTNTTRCGFLTISDAKIVFVDLYVVQRQRISDVKLWDKDDGNPEGTFSYDVVNRVDQTTVTLDRLPADARDGAGVAKGAANFDPSTAMPNFVTQTRLLAANTVYIDRYALDGTYQDRVPLPGGIATEGSKSALGNLSWRHVQVAETTSSFPYAFYDQASNATVFPVANPKIGLPYWQVSFDDGATWTPYYLASGTFFGPDTRPYSGMIPLFSV